MAEATPDDNDDDSVNGTAIPAAPNAAVSVEKPFKCDVCGKQFDKQVALMGHHKSHDAEARRKSEEKRRKEIDEKRKRTPDEIAADIAQRGGEAMEELLGLRFEELLDTPGVPAMAKDYALREWANDPAMHFDMEALWTMLTQDAGASKDKSLRIIQRLQATFEQFRPALEKVEQPYFRPYAPQNRGGYGQPPAAPPGYPYAVGANPWMGTYPSPDYRIYYGPYGQPYPYAPPPPFREERGVMTSGEVARIVRDEVKRLEDKIADNKDASNAVASATAGAKTTRTVTLDDGSKYEVSPQLSEQMLMARIMNGGGGSRRGNNNDDEKSLIAAELETRIGPLQTQLRDVTQQLAQEREARHTAEVERLDAERNGLEKQLNLLKDEIKNIRSDAKEEVRAAQARANAAGFKSDSMKLIGEGMNKIGDVWGKKDPLGKLWDLATSKPKDVERTTESDELKELETEGFVLEH